MKEVEVKAKLTDVEKIKSELLKLGCSFSETLIQKDKIYLHKSIEIPDIKKGTVVLRIRNCNNKFILTLNEILKLMDYYEAVKVNKKRIKCKYKELEICIDEVENLGNFIEVEKMTDEDSLKIQKELFEFLETLGIKKEEQVFKGYDILVYELNQNKSFSEK